MRTHYTRFTTGITVSVILAVLLAPGLRNAAPIESAGAGVMRVDTQVGPIAIPASSQDGSVVVRTGLDRTVTRFVATEAVTQSTGIASRPLLPSQTIYTIDLDIRTEEERLFAVAAGVPDPRLGAGRYEVTAHGVSQLVRHGLDGILVGGRSTVDGSALKERANADETSDAKMGTIQASGSFVLDSGTVNDAIPDNSWLYRWIQVGSGAAAPPGSTTTNVAYTLRIHNAVNPTEIFCGDYEIYLSSDARGGGVPNYLVYDNRGSRTDGGWDDDTADDHDIYLAARSTSHFDGENPNQNWYVYIRDTVFADTGHLQYIVFDISWDAPAQTDLSAFDVYLRTATYPNGARTDSPGVGEVLYPHFSFSVSGAPTPSATLWRIQIDGETRCTYFGTLVPGTYEGFCNAPWTALAGLHNLNGRVNPDGNIPESSTANNETNRNYTIAQQPIDLSAQDVYLRTAATGGGTRVDSPTLGAVLYPTFSFTVSGSTTPYTTLWRIQLDGATRCTYSGALAPGSYIGWCEAPWTVTSGLHNLNGRVNPNGTISETTSGNNEANRNYTVGASGPAIRIAPLSIQLSSPSGSASSSQPMATEAVVPYADLSSSVRQLMSRMDTGGTVRTIVRLDVSRNGLVQQSDASIAFESAEIARVQDRVLDSTRGAGRIRVTGRFTYVPFLALEVDTDALLSLARQPDVLAIEEDRLAKPALASSVPVIRADDVWAAGYTGSGQAIAILDTGVDKGHPFFSTGTQKVVSEACYSSNYCPGGVTESTATNSGVHCPTTQSACKHGTHVAGIAGGGGGGGSNIGVARGASIIAIQVFSLVTACGTNPSPCVRSYISDQMKGLERVYSLRNTFNIASANLSLGDGASYSSQVTCDSAYAGMKAIIDQLRAAKIATVIAAGNDAYRSGINGPGCISTAVSVGNSTDSDQVTSSSNVASFLSLFAPGTAITAPVPGTGTETWDGTSMAAPHVAGAWALLKQKAPSLTVDQGLNALRSTGVLIDDQRSGGTVNNIPRIDVFAAINSLSGGGTSFTIFNDGQSTLTVTSISRETAAPWLSWSPAAPFNVAPGGSQAVTLSVNWSQANVGQNTTRLLVSSNDSTKSPYPGGVYVTATKSPGVVTAGKDDFNRDGKDDMIWRNGTTGANSYWFLNGTAVAGGGTAPPVSDINWKLAGTGDFNADTHTDMLWHNNVTAANAVWFMNGPNFSSQTSLASAAVQWKPSGVGDFNGNGTNDVVWRNSVTGENSIWLLNGTTVAGGGAITSVTDMTWRLVGAGDINGDGRADLIWWNSASGALSGWLMNGLASTSVFIGQVADTVWKASAVADTNGDGRADVIWRNVTNGSAAVWFLNGSTVTGGGFIGAVADLQFDVVGAK